MSHAGGKQDSEPTANVSEVELAWDAEIRRRIERYDCGEVKSIPAVDVFKGLAERYLVKQQPFSEHG